VGNRRGGGCVVQFQHRRAPSQQVLAQQLRLPVPGFPHHLSHALVFASQLRYLRDGHGSVADPALPHSVLQDRRSQRRFLLLRRLRQRFAPVHSGVV